MGLNSDNGHEIYRSKEIKEISPQLWRNLMTEYIEVSRDRRRGRGQVTGVPGWSCRSIHWDGMCRMSRRSGQGKTVSSVWVTDIREPEGCTDGNICQAVTPTESKPEILRGITEVWDCMRTPGSMWEGDNKRWSTEGMTFLPKESEDSPKRRENSQESMMSMTVRKKGFWKAPADVTGIMLNPVGTHLSDESLCLEGGRRKSMCIFNHNMR